MDLYSCSLVEKTYSIMNFLQSNIIWQIELKDGCDMRNKVYCKQYKDRFAVSSIMHLSILEEGTGGICFYVEDNPSGLELP